MREELEAIKDAWDNTDGLRDEPLARQLADALVEGNPSLFEEIRTKPMEVLCQDIDIFRAAEMEEQVWLIETWLLHRYDPQQIGGNYQPQIRIAGME